MQPPTNKFSPPAKTRHPVRLGILLTVLAGLLLIAFNLRAITDWLALRSYAPPKAVATLATQTTMTPAARHIFYVNHPSLNDKPTFAKECPNGAREKTIVLGCYHGNQRGIYLLDVTDERLSGVEDVTAAHEMLHAAYDRLSTKERKQIDAQLQAYYDHDLHDQRIIDTIAAYRKSEPNDLVNEMHSIFGTEVAQLPSGLEHYYQRYFTDRTTVVKYASDYQAAFTSRETAVKEDDAKLANLRNEIDVDEADLKARQVAIVSTQKSLVTLRNSGSTEAYNNGVPGYNAMVDAYNQKAAGLKLLIEQYNQLVVARNNIALEEVDLLNQLSTSTSPIKQ